METRLCISVPRIHYFLLEVAVTSKPQQEKIEYHKHVTLFVSYCKPGFKFVVPAVSARRVPSLPTAGWQVTQLQIPVLKVAPGRLFLHARL